MTQRVGIETGRGRMSRRKDSEEPMTASVTRYLEASPGTVFDAWLEPEMVRLWMFGPELRDDEEVLRISIDARVGGSFSFLVRRQGEEIDHVGVYLQLERPRRLVFTWAAPPHDDVARVVVEIVPHARKCRLTVTHELHPDRSDQMDRIGASWARRLEALAELLQTRPAALPDSP